MKTADTVLRIPCGRSTELVKLRRRSHGGLLEVQRSTGTRIWINDTQILSTQEKAR